ncbi:inactive peptidyl-prolyl cis-trans isomerase FKBP6-like isoform X2 [Dysidea avara]|uniref:inactive peptidyl-prolyl cis-trans isomerase FKBP6-like isoform X2 n=1 Tax=Dysidea avara TaxID=196820 RepID=UPI00331C924D
MDDPEAPGDAPLRLRAGLDVQDLTSGKGAELVFDDNQGLTDAPASPPTYESEKMFQQLNYQCTLDSDDLTPFELIAVEMEDITAAKDGGVMKKVLKQGTGNVVPDKAIVRVHYNGYLEYSEEPYDSSRLRNRQEQFTLGKGQVIPGWDIGISTMRRNELARFLVKSSYAYGDLGCPPRIPPKATIMFEIELISFVDHNAADSYAAFTPEERENASVSQLVEVARAERELGNDFFHQNMFGKAMRKYEKAVSLIENVRLQNEEEEIVWRDNLMKLYLNLSLCCLKQAKSSRAITYGRKVLDLEPNSAKANYRLGQAYMQLAEFTRSKEYLMRAGKLAPNNAEIRQELQKLDRKIQKYNAMEKVTYTRMLGTQPGPDTTHKSKTSSSGAATKVKEEEESIKQILSSRLSSFLDNELEMEFALPSNFDPEEIECAIQVAEEMGVLYEKGGKHKDFSVRFYKPEIEQ